MKRQRPRMLRRGSGFTLVEALVALSLSALIVGMVSSFLNVMTVNVDRQQMDRTLGDSGRNALEEMLGNLRGASQVVLSDTVQGTVTDTNGQQLTFRAPGYDPATTAVTLTEDDRIAYVYSSRERVIRQYIQPASGSVRPERNGFVIARNVEAVHYQFIAQETIKATSSGTMTHTLEATPMTEPLIVVNGAAVDGEWNPESRTVTFATPRRGAKVQFLYTIQPTDTAALSHVVQIGVEVLFSGKQGRIDTRRVVMPGSAQLRNRRIAQEEVRES